MSVRSSSKRGLLVIALTFVAAAVAVDTTVVKSQNSGLTVDPTIYELSAEPGDNITLENNISNLASDDIVSLTGSDFKQGDGGVPVMLGDDETNNYGLASWIVEDNEIYTNNTNSTEAKVNFSLEVPRDALNQTYYGTALFSKTDNKTESVPLDTSTGSLIFVDIGEPEYSASVANFDLSEDKSVGNNLIDGTNLDASSTSNDIYLFTVDIGNDGKYRFTPKIEIDIVDQNKKVFTTLKTEEDPGSILPETTRTYEISTDKADFDTSTTYSACLKVQTPDGKLTKSSLVFGNASDSDNPSCEDEEFNLVPFLIIGGLLLAVLGGIAVAIIGRRNNKKQNLASASAEKFQTHNEPIKAQEPTNNLIAQQKPSEDSSTEDIQK